MPAISLHTNPRPESTTLMATLLILLGGLWLCWLWRLHPTKTPDDPPVRCHQIAPTLRSTLLVFTALLLLSAVVLFGRVLLSGVLNGHMWAHRGVHLLLLLVVLILQLSYLLHMRKSRTLVMSRISETAGGCSVSDSGWRSVQRWVLVGFALVQVGVGSWVLGRVSSSSASR